MKAKQLNISHFKDRNFLFTFFFFVVYTLLLFACSKTEDAPTVSSKSLTVSGVGSATSITTNEGTLQMSTMDGTTAVTNAKWTVTELDGSATTKATISANGLLTASANGTVKVKAVYSGKEGTVDILLFLIKKVIHLTI